MFVGFFILEFESNFVFLNVYYFLKEKGFLVGVICFFMVFKFFLCIFLFFKNSLEDIKEFVNIFLNYFKI